MPIPPIQFQRPPRQVSPIEQAILGVLGQYAGRKLVTEPVMREQAAQREKEQAAQRGFITSERLGAQAFTTSERKAAEEARLTAMEREADLNRSAAVFTGLEIPLRQAEATQTFEESIAPTPGMVSFLHEAERTAGIKPGAVADPTYRAESEKLTDWALRVAQIRTQQAAVRAQSGSDMDYLERFITKVDLSKLPPILIKDPDSGELRAPTAQEQAYRQFAPGLTGAEILGHEKDPRVIRAQGIIRDIEARTVPIPAYDPEQEAKLLGSFQHPDNTAAAQLQYLIEAMRNLPEERRLVGGEGRHLWFIDDNRKRQDVGSVDELLAKMPGMAQARLRGAVWAKMFLQDPDRFKAAQATYGLYDPVALDTYNRIMGQPAVERSPSPPTSTPATPPSKGPAGNLLNASPPPSPPPFSFTSPAAQAFADTASAKGKEQVQSYTEAMLRDSTYYDEAMAAVQRGTSLVDDEQYRQWLAKLWPGGGYAAVGGEPKTVAARMRFGVPYRRPLPSRDRVRFEMMSQLELARVEALAQRARGGQPNYVERR